MVRSVVYLPKRHISYDLWINIMNFLQKYFELLCFFLISYSKLNNFTCIGPLIEKLSKKVLLLLSYSSAFRSAAEEL